MNKNDFISDNGQLSVEILLNIAEMLTLRLPEGSGMEEIVYKYS